MTCRVFGQRRNDAIPAARMKPGRMREYDGGLRRIGGAPFEVTQIDITDANVAFDRFTD